MAVRLVIVAFVALAMAAVGGVALIDTTEAARTVYRLSLAPGVPSGAVPIRSRWESPK